MTALSYHPYYACVRVYQTGGFGYLAGWRSVVELRDLGRTAPCEIYLIDAGDNVTEATHQHAKQSQRDRDYTRQRLGAPRYTYAEERVRTGRQSVTDSADPYLELVMAGDGELAAWCRERATLAGRSVVVRRRPVEVHCHTPLNQRLLPANMEVCQRLIEFLADVKDDEWYDDNPPLLAAACFVLLADSLGLDHAKRVSVTSFGSAYLARFLDWSGPTSSPTTAQRRVRQIEAAVDRIASGPRDQRTRQLWRGAGLRDDHGSFFPESLWMQFHWFTSSLGVSLTQELALTEALGEWLKMRPPVRREP